MSRRLGLIPAAEVGLVAVTLATVAGMWRLFADGSFFWPLAGHAIAAHVLAATCRRRGVPTPIAAAVVAAAGVLALTWAHLGETTALGLPTGTTVDTARLRLEEAWRLFDDVRAPAPVLPGFLLAAGAALWVAAFLADVAAFRLWTSFEPLIPSGTMFVFASVFAADRSRAQAAALWLAAALAFTLLHRTARQHGSPAWLGSDTRLGTQSLLRAGAVLVVGAVIGGLLIGPRLPGASAEPIVSLTDLSDDGEGGSRETISPLVEIRGRLVEQSNRVMFTVRTSRRAYWRLTALDQFDGSVWSSQGTYEQAEGELDGLGPRPAGSVDVVQTFSVSSLNAIWLPAAFEPREVEPGDAEVRWAEETSTLIVPNDQPSSNGLTYQVVSAVPANVDPGVLAAASDEVPPEVLERGLALPADFPPSVVGLAQQVVADAGAVTPYQRALALQSFFRDGGFTYTLDAPAGHSDTAIEAFLFETRAGYCEQFAGSYAAMARALGLPARVAVGFTPGVILDATDPTLYTVRGEHAHAWPEVWIPGYGWLPFEPTPGRGAPDAEYTGVPESQAATGDPTTATTATTVFVEEAPVETTLAPGATTATTAPPDPDEVTADDEDDEAALTQLWRTARRILLWVLAGVGLLVAVAASIAGARLAHRWRRRVSAATADAGVRAAWADALDAVGVVGIVPRRHETPLEFAARAGHSLRDTNLWSLAWLLEKAEFADVPVDDAEAEDAAAHAKGVAAAVRASTTRWMRLLALVDPRPPARRGVRRGPRPAGPRLQISSAG